MLFHALFARLSFFFFNDTATTEIYTLSLHDALPISSRPTVSPCGRCRFAYRSGRSPCLRAVQTRASFNIQSSRSEEHTSELQSPCNLVCRLLLEKKKLFFFDPRYSNIPSSGFCH